MVWLNSHHTVHSHGISLLHPIWPEFFLLTLGKPTISAGKSQFFIDFHGSQTVSNCQRDPEEKYRYIRISYPHFSCWTPHSSLKWQEIRHPKKHEMVGRFLDFLRIFSRFTFAYWTLSGISGRGVDFCRSWSEGEKVMVFLWSFKDKMMFLLCLFCWLKILKMNFKEI